MEKQLFYSPESRNPLPRKRREKPTPAQMRERAKERTAAARKQTEGFESSEIFKKTVEAKLAELRPTVDERLAEKKVPEKWWQNFQRCGEESFWTACVLCGRSRELPYQCNLKWCPRCNWRIADRRRRELEATTCMMCHTKHLVLTQKNFSENLLDHARAAKKNIAKLRRRKLFGVVRGGCQSLEFTNEEKGWHMHWHLLIDSNFLPIDQVAVQWGKIVGQEFAIVHIKPVKQGSYLQEVCKYAVKGSELAGWTGEQIFEFAAMCRHVRMFETWGNFVEERRVAKLFLKQTRPRPEPCPCGCTEIRTGATESEACKWASIAQQKGYF